MRIFPPPEEGLHEAFPLAPDPRISHNILPGTVHTATIAGLLRLGIAFTFRRPTPLVSASKTVAYTAAVVAPAFQLLEWNNSIAVKRFLSSQNVDLPKPKLFDRLGSFDEDDCLILGGCIGTFAATRMRRPWGITGWRRYFTAFTLGSWVSDIAFTFRQRWSKTPEQCEESKLEWQKYSAQHSAWAPLLAQHKPVNILATSSADVNVGPLTRGIGSQLNGGVTTGAPMDHPALHPILKDGPHIALQSPDDSEPIPLPGTNYTWASSQPIEHLEQHIAKLTERRQRLALEAELMWAWLSEKEAEYYSYSESKGEPETPDGQARLVYLKQLGGAHAGVWREVSHCDWMIADSHKRIEQIRSRLASNEDQVTWRAGCSKAAREVKPECAIRTLQKFDRDTSTALHALSQLRLAVAASRGTAADQTANALTEKMFNPIAKKITTKKEYLEDMEREIRKVRDELELAQRIAGELKAELESR